MPMGMHDHECPKCNIMETLAQMGGSCKKCGEAMNIVSAPSTPIFKEFWHPNITHDPIHIKSAKALDQACVENGVHIKESPANEKYVRLPQTREEALNA